jgi:small subunit ribosomal protein S15
MAFVKKEIVEQFKTHGTDTGSPEVQVALLTTRIKYLSDHFQKFPKDFASRVGFLKMIGQRRRLLDYLKKHNKESYSTLIKKLDLRK